MTPPLTAYSPTVSLRSSVPHVSRMKDKTCWTGWHCMIWSMFRSCIVEVGLLFLFIFLKVPPSLLTSARLLISLFYLLLTTRHRSSAHKSIAEDWEGECLAWPPLPQYVTLVSSTPTHTYTHKYRTTRMHKMNESLCLLYPHLWSQLQFWLILKSCKVRAGLCVYLVLADAVR